MCISALGWPEGSVEEPWTAFSQKTCGGRFCQSRAAHKNAGSAPINALSCAGNQPQRCVRRRLRSVSLTTPPRYAAAPCFGFLPLLRSDELRAPPRRLRASQRAAEPLTRCLHGRAPRASTYGRNPRGNRRAQSVWQGRSLYPTASSQPTARSRAPARLRALERAPCRAPCRAPGPNPGLFPLRWADWRSASWDMRLIMR